MVLQALSHLHLVPGRAFHYVLQRRFARVPRTRGGRNPGMRLQAVLVPILLAATSCAAIASPPKLRDGDIVFQASRSDQSDAIRRATGSPYTHMGLIFLEHGKPLVLEAVGPVKWTALDEWIQRGVGRRYVVKR